MGKVVQLRPAHTFDATRAKDNNMIGKKIGDARKKAGLTQGQFAKKLEEYGISVKTPAVNKWEGGDNVPNAYQLLAICHALGIREGLDYFTGYIDAPEKTLNAEGRRMLRRYVEFLMGDERYTRHKLEDSDIEADEGNNEDVRTFYAASAGYGVALEDEDYEIVSYPESMVPEGTDFAVKVSGDSMEPMYHDGQIVFVEQTDSLDDGEVGIFDYEGEGYIKQYREIMPKEEEIEDYLDAWGFLRPKVYLVSINKNKYKPMRVKPHEDLKIFGRVLN